MSDLRELLRASAFAPRGVLDIDALHQRVRRRRRRRSVAVAVTVSLASVAAAVALLAPRGDDNTIVMVPPTATEVGGPSTTPTSIVPTEATIAPTTAAVAPSVSAAATSTSTSSTSPPTTTSPPVVTGPDGLRRVNVRVVGPNGTPFPKSTVTAQACPVTGDPCAYAGVVDDAGTVYLELDPDVQYNINAMVRNTGWANPWISPTGVGFHFSESIERTGAELEDGTVFVIEEPSA